MGNRVASAARKKQPKAKRKSSSGSRGAAKSRGAKSRTPRATGVRRVKPARAGKKRVVSAKKRVVRTARPAPKPVRKKSTAKRLVKPVARKVGKKKPAAAAKQPVRKPIVRPAAKRVRKRAAIVAPRRIAKPITKLARRERAGSKPSQRRASVPVPPAFAVQRASADARGMLLFELARARAAVKAAIQGLTGASALQSTAPGKWSSFEIVLHLSERDRVRLDEFDRTLAGEPRSWVGMHDPEMGPVNESHLAPLRAHTWDEAVRRMDSLREELLARLEALPAEPDHVWKQGHAFGDMMWGLPEHDRHHAMQIKNARIGGHAPLEA